MELTMSKDDTETLITDILCNSATAEVAKVRARWIAQGYWKLGGKTLTDLGLAALLRPQQRFDR
jgi:hypothetical protein